MKYECNDTLTPANEPCSCDYARKVIKSIDVKKDENGQFLVRINGDGEWYGVTYDPETQSLHYSY